tara:strand:- start:4584 stop:5204 length:621 start_codon:yes stop_codon:yes gene_type:complete
MTTAQTLRNHIQSLQLGKPFTNERLLKAGTRTAVDKCLSRFTREGMLHRLAQGVYMRPKENAFIGTVMPEISEILHVITRHHGETIEVHGAEAARRFKLTTQMPTTPVYYTNGPSRTLKIGKIMVKLMHTTSHRRLQFAGKRQGLALSALWYLGKDNVTATTIEKIQVGLSAEEYQSLKRANIPAWMSHALNDKMANNQKTDNHYD